MSLNFQLSQIDEWQTTCYWEYDEETMYGPTGQIESGRRIKAVTEHLIWMAMVVELQAITPENVGEWWARLCLAYGLDASTHITSKGEPVRATMDDVIAHIGLSTNVSKSTRHSWLTRKDGQVWNRMDEFAIDTALKAGPKAIV